MNSPAEDDVEDPLSKPRKLTIRLDRLIREFSQTEVYKKRPELGQAIQSVLERIRWSYCFNPGAENLRSFSLHKRLSGEIQESAVTLGFLVDALENFRNRKGTNFESISIFDVCSGKGYFSVVLAYLWANKYKRLQGLDLRKISLLDMHWEPVWTKAIANARKNYIREDHLPVVSRETGVKLDPVRVNIHNVEAMDIINAAPCAAIVVGVHLCKGLSLRLVELFNKSTTGRALILCPCCLPARRNPGSKVSLGKYEIDVHELYLSENPYKDWVHFILECVEASEKRVEEEPLSRISQHGPAVKGLGRRNMFIIAFK